ncbi:MAG: hypothetical protein HQM10_01020 [Candidatus Riflebacteria bacterium]|nr:hypothetical protein [Candidatus Riflebacteria bacterium]
MFEQVLDKDVVIAIIIKTDFEKTGIEFFTPPHFSQQLAYMKRPRDYFIEPHVHNPIPREVVLTQEVLFIKSGKVRVDFYSDEKEYLSSRVLHPGDVILLAGGGHSFMMLEESEIIEVKQGPFSGEKDKQRFSAVNENSIIVQEKAL